MATMRQQAEWTRAAVMTANLMSCHVKGGVNPIKLIPPPYRPTLVEEQKTPAMIADENKRGWKILDRAMGQMAGKKRKRKQ